MRAPADISHPIAPDLDVSAWVYFMIDHRLNIDKVIATLSAVNILLCTINAGSTDKNMEHRLLYHSTAENAN